MRGVVVSDLHLFARRARPEIESTIIDAIQGRNFLVLNGDIFDFAWSTHGSLAATVEQSVAFLGRICHSNPECRVHYIMGNHDNIAALAEALTDVSLPNFSWHPAYITIGPSLFLHGDLPLSAKNPFLRKLRHTASPKHAALHHLYDLAVRTRVHAGAAKLYTPSLCARTILQAIEQHDAHKLGGVEHIYFGHTHAPFSDFEYRGYYFHNTGSGIKHLEMRVLHATGTAQ